MASSFPAAKSSLFRSTVQDANAMSNNPLVLRAGAAAAAVDGDAKVATTQMFQRKCPFHVASDGITFDNKPGFVESLGIRFFHWISRINLQWGSLRAWWNPFVSIPAFVLYIIDLAWAGMDKEYYVKRRALFGPNFVSVASVVVTKYDSKGTDPDSLDGRLLSIPQRRGLFLGSTIMNRFHLPQMKRSDGKNKKPLSASPLHVSDGGASMDPIHPDDQPNHEELRQYLMDNLLSDEKMNDIIKRAQDSTTKSFLTEFGQNTKGMDYNNNSTELASHVETVLVKYLIYTIFGFNPNQEEYDLIYDTFYKDLRFVFYLYGPRWLFSWLGRNVFGIAKTKANLRKVTELFLTKSPVLKEVTEGPNGLNKEGLISMINMVVGIAAFQGTKQLAITTITQTPLEERDRASNNSNNMRKLILETARMDTPVTGAHCIVDDEDGMITTIGNKKLKFPRGTTLFTGLTLANTDEERFSPDPYVFDTERNHNDLLTSFHSIGMEKTNPKHPRICPGREIAILCVSQLLQAKLDAEKNERSRE